MSSLTIDRARRCVRLADREIRLSPQAYRVLLYLAQHTGEVVAKEDLMGAMWPDADRENDWAYRSDLSAVDLVIFRLRQKLGDTAGQPTYLETRRGFGYILHHASIVEPAASVEDESRDVHRDRPAASGGSTERSPAPWATLTRREWEIFLLLGDEQATRLTNKALAQHLGIAASTLKKHLQNIYRKLGVSNRAGVALLAIQARSGLGR